MRRPQEACLSQSLLDCPGTLPAHDGALAGSLVDAEGRYRRCCCHGATGVLTILQSGSKTRLQRITKGVFEVVCHLAAGQLLTHAVGGESIGVVAESLGVDTFELNREVRRAAVAEGIEAIRLAAGAFADQIHFDVDTA